MHRYGVTAPAATPAAPGMETGGGHFAGRDEARCGLLARVDWSTLLASAGVSAVVGAVVSLLAVSQTTVRRAKAERADASRLAVRECVAPLLAELARYQYVGLERAKREAETSHMDDHAHVVAIRSAAADLPGWRRWLVDRRCRRVFGDYWTDLARDYPSVGRETGGTLTAWFAASVAESKRPPGARPVDGLMHRAYSQQSGHTLVDRLRRELRRLAAAR